MSSGTRIAVLGFGVTGKSVVRHLLREGMVPVVLDTRPAPADLGTDIAHFAGTEFHWRCTEWRDIGVESAILSPGLSMRNCLVRGAQHAQVSLRSDIDLFFEHVDAPVIGITGTNGKSTVTELVGHLLNAAGVQAGVGGNLGEPALDLLRSDNECYVLELSSFQLERSREPALHSATVLNVTADHLDHHGDLAAYRASKLRVYTEARRAIYNRDDPLTQPDREDAVSFGGGLPPGDEDWGIVRADASDWLARGQTRIADLASLPLRGAHNALNMMAACALVESWVSTTTMNSALGTFAGLPHRMQTVAQIDGVTYIDDSKATNLGAALAALEVMPLEDAVLLIAGGDAKGVDLTALAPAMRGRVRFVATLGRDGPAVGRVAAAAGLAYLDCDSIESAVAACRARARSGDTVLLSPACASIDMFTSYRERGERFAAAARGGARG